ncbi:MAG: ATP-grasp domain-containing protein [Planctomycetia bacterium]|nr:ATP-grasp domain-containing protein [Planctomycetia bacterium]
MSAAGNLMILGASARAAAFSALRAGLKPWCADLFADADLQARCPAMRLPPDTYPQGFADLMQTELAGPWMYTGGLENYPQLVRKMAARRPLWGSAASALVACRSPAVWREHLQKEYLPSPRCLPYGAPLAAPGQWLLKPLRSCGGAGIQFFDGDHTRPRSGVYLQEYIQGESCAALFLGSGFSADLLGVTRQLVGEDWLRARPFCYCGSIGPLPVDRVLKHALQRLGTALASHCPLMGLFGVDCVVRDGVPYPVEINPRYTASAEVLEYAANVPALALHAVAFDPQALPEDARPLPELRPGLVGKAILFARQTLDFPADGPWREAIEQPDDIWQLPAFADIPHPGECITEGKPILTYFVRGESEEDCREKLKLGAAALEQRLFG